MSASSIEVFYALDERRKRSPEVDYGVWWKWQGQNWRVSWIEATGELIAVRLGPTTVGTIRVATHEVGLAVLAGQPMDVVVLAVVHDLEVVERLMEGWVDVCGSDESLGWVEQRVKGAQHG